jgi:hypothetical protein
MEQSYKAQVSLLTAAKVGTWDTIDGLKGRKYKNKVREIIKECAAPNALGSNWKMHWALGEPGAKVKLCKRAFCKILGCGYSFVAELISDIKNHKMESVPRIDDRGNPFGKEETKKILETAQETFGVSLSHHQLGSALLPNSALAKSVAAWMESTFQQMGDYVPNCAGEIHLSNMTKHSLYMDYCNHHKDMKQPDEIASETEFVKVWRCCFDHVKARKFLNVCGKCSTCGDINEERCKTLNPRKREAYTQLAALHRTMFMAERRLYYGRRNEAIASPSFVLSTIADGMAQSHCEIPYRARAAQFTPNMTQHLLGIINHGTKKFTMYRSFGNLEGKFNLSAYCWLRELEKEYDANESRLQETIYHQMDGGSENANWETLALAELLVIKGLTKKIVITRLPVGHTHEVRFSSMLLFLFKSVRPILLRVTTMSQRCELDLYYFE